MSYKRAASQSHDFHTTLYYTHFNVICSIYKLESQNYNSLRGWLSVIDVSDIIWSLIQTWWEL